MERNLVAVAVLLFSISYHMWCALMYVAVTEALWLCVCAVCDVHWYIYMLLLLKHCGTVSVQMWCALMYVAVTEALWLCVCAVCDVHWYIYMLLLLKHCGTVSVQYVNKSIQEKYIQQVFDAVLCSPEIENIQPKLGQYFVCWKKSTSKGSCNVDISQTCCITFVM